MESFLGYLFSILLIIMMVLLIVFSFFFFIKLLIKGSMEFEERIYTDIDNNCYRYVLKLKNPKKKLISIKSFGILVKPYSLMLSDNHFPQEASTLDISPKFSYEIDLTELIQAKKWLQDHKKVYFYYEDAFSDVHIRKLNYLNKFVKVINDNKIA